ncbi:hypothetical protein FIV07_14280 [Mycobacterium sp. THAF192]|nr:hypothetical protein FIV07_14280 [Mycobacterium sp. THAF192]
MPAVGGSAGSYGRLIVTPDMEPPDAGHWDAQEQTYRVGATTWDGIHQKIVTDNAEFRDAADSQGFDEAHRAGAVLAEEAKTIAEWHDKCANKCADIATVLRDTRAGQEQLVREADAKIASAKLPGEAEALVTQYHGIARYQTEAGVTAAMASHTAFKASTENTRALDLLTKWGDAPTAPPVQPVDHTSPGIEQDENPYSDTEKREAGADAPKPVDDAPTDPAGTSTTQPGVSPGSKSAAGDESIKAATGPVTQPTPGVTSSPAASALGGAGMPSMGGIGGGGMGSGGGIPKMPGGLGSGGMPGMGSNPLSGGVGQMPGAASGLPNPGAVPGAGSASPLSSAFNQGMATTAGMGGGIPSAPPPAPASPSPALSAGGGHAAPPVSAAPGGGVSPAGAQAGMVSPATPAAAAPTGAGIGGGGAPMMLPPGSMGPPAGAPPPAPTVPAGTVGSTNAPAAPAPSAASAAAGPTLIPASVVAAGQTAAARERRESADAAAAKELVWKLQHAAYVALNPAAGWAVGVFRSPSGTETVITSNDGSSYIPAGVFVPRSVRVLATDPLVDDSFRQRWFGWGDPARVLVEYAQLRAQRGWKLVAAATTAGVSVLRDAGVEHPPSCSGDTNPLLQQGVDVPAPVLDDMHIHRLAVLWPEVYPRLLRIMDADPLCQDRIVSAVTAAMINAATTQAQVIDGGIDEALRLVWAVRGSDREPTVQQWADYDKAAKALNVMTAMRRPAFATNTGAVADPSDTTEFLADYRAHWLVARTAEHIGGWSRRPLPLPDMCYAAAATGDPDLRDMIVKALVSVEEDLQYEAPR